MSYHKHRRKSVLFVSGVYIMNTSVIWNGMRNESVVCLFLFGSKKIYNNIYQVEYIYIYVVNIKETCTDS